MYPADDWKSVNANCDLILLCLLNCALESSGQVEMSFLPISPIIQCCYIFKSRSKDVDKLTAALTVVSTVTELLFIYNSFTGTCM